MEHERIPPKTPSKNAHIESFHAVLEDECLRRSEFEMFAEAHEAVLEFINFYNERRIHGSLYDLSLKEFGSSKRWTGKTVGCEAVIA
ncbi:integrase core domain-containing protein [Tumebacillus permanentifrigoris]|uniref:Integrase-like protein n=1 Tax=Tumebacillus permanentifrigoris TaxID=378543 RepID=A0A316DEZ8_9BACL|nr:integrase core domain-containing protein [Tumebacillus permanentifrigoris]PWK16142.1 integrase-like protein [Tumebacillus permanentifrigoris]